MTRFRWGILVLVLALVLPPLLSACTVAPHRDRDGRGAYGSDSID